VIVIVMGVSGSGKTTIARMLAQRIAVRFYEGDNFHPARNIAKMAGGEALSDADREPWLERLGAELAAIDRGGADAVFACSALKQSYRDQLSRAARDVRFVYLRGDWATIASRLDARVGHYMPASLLESQFEALEEPDNAIVIDIRLSPEVQVATIYRQLSREPRRA
jgi:gluconokinase